LPDKKIPNLHNGLPPMLTETFPIHADRHQFSSKGATGEKGHRPKIWPKTDAVVCRMGAVIPAQNGIAVG
jgi:hypothetical protein